MPVLALLLLAAAPAPLKVGVTLHPYYSWTANVAKELPIEVRPVLPGDVDVGNYQPRPEDIAKLKDLDALVINGVGHDDFIEGMLKASGNTRCTVIRPNDGTALLKNVKGGAVNSHTFLSFTNAVQQTYAIARALEGLRPELAPKLEANAQAYAKRLRQEKAQAVARLAGAPETRVVTVHDGYSYLLQELGLELAGVVEPAHGLLPSAKELGEVVELLRTKKVKVVLSEASFPPAMLEVLKQSGAQVSVLSHIATGAFTPERFEVEIQKNVDALAKAVGAK
jgi:zinc transport system substrate-binding protein